MIPHDYPQNPPRASFRTRIWHPNVDESSGDICVDTLKKDWVQSLTLRDILLTISCLLIYPNPKSALNSTAGHLLQEDYQVFARQARLMTSVHARIPPGLQCLVHASRMRGEDASMTLKGGARSAPCTDKETVASSIVVMKPKTQNMVLPQESSASMANAALLGCDYPMQLRADQELGETKENDQTLLSIPSRMKRRRSSITLAQNLELEPSHQDPTCQNTDNPNGTEHLPTMLLRSASHDHDNQSDQLEPSAKSRCPSRTMECQAKTDGNSLDICHRTSPSDCPSTSRVVSGQRNGCSRPAMKKVRTGLKRL